MFVLTDPTYRSDDRFSTDPMVLRIARASSGSPACVPVPCASTYPVSAGSTPACRYAVRINSCCASLFGNEMPGVRPSSLAAVASTTARMLSPSRIAASKGYMPSLVSQILIPKPWRQRLVHTFKIVTPNPSPRAKPFASASHILLLPSGDRILAAPRRIDISGPNIRLAPPTTLISASPVRML